jgi:hypothetical protein
VRSRERTIGAQRGIEGKTTTPSLSIRSEFARTTGMDRTRPKSGHCEILRADRTHIPRTTYSRPCSSALLIHQDLPALAGPAVALCTNSARILSVPAWCRKDAAGWESHCN